MKRLAAIIVGLLAVTVLPACGGGGKGTEVTAYFPRAVSVYKDSQVKILGLQAGQVKAVEVEGDRVRIDMVIDAGQAVPEDVQAMIVPASLIGERYVQLFPVWKEGTPKAKSGKVIPISKSVVPVEPDEALEALDEFIKSLDPDGLGRLIENAAETLDGKGQSLNQTLDGVAKLIDLLARNDATLIRIFENFDKLSATLVTRDTQLGQTLDLFAQATKTLADNREEVQGLVQALAELSTNGLGLVSEHGDRLKTDLQTLTTLSQSVVANIDRVDALIESGPPLVTGFRNAYDATNHWVNLRNNFGPLASSATNPLLALAEALGVPEVPRVCVPVLQTCPSTSSSSVTVLATTGAAPFVGTSAGPSAELPLSATPIDGVLDLMSTPGPTNPSVESAPTPGGVRGWLSSVGRAVSGVLS